MSEGLKVAQSSFCPYCHCSTRRKDAILVYSMKMSLALSRWVYHCWALKVLYLLGAVVIWTGRLLSLKASLKIMAARRVWAEDVSQGLKVLKSGGLKVLKS